MWEYGTYMTNINKKYWCRGIFLQFMKIVIIFLYLWKIVLQFICSKEIQPVQGSMVCEIYKTRFYITVFNTHLSFLDFVVLVENVGLEKLKKIKNWYWFFLFFSCKKGDLCLENKPCEEQYGYICKKFIF